VVLVAPPAVQCDRAGDAKGFRTGVEIEPHSIDAKIGIAMCSLPICLATTTAGGGVPSAGQRARRQLLVEAIEGDHTGSLARSAMGFFAGFRTD